MVDNITFTPETKNLLSSIVHAFFESAVRDKNFKSLKSTEIILNKTGSGNIESMFAIKSSVINDYNHRHGKRYDLSENEIRVLPEFIERVKNGEKISLYDEADESVEDLENDYNEEYHKLVVETIPEDAVKYNAYHINRSAFRCFDENLEIDHEKIKICKELEKMKESQRVFFEMINKVLYETDLPLKKRMDYLQMMAPQIVLEDAQVENKLDVVAENLKYMPGFGEEFKKSESSYYSVKATMPINK